MLEKFQANFIGRFLQGANTIMNPTPRVIADLEKQNPNSNIGGGLFTQEYVDEQNAICARIGSFTVETTVNILTEVALMYAEYKVIDVAIEVWKARRAVRALKVLNCFPPDTLVATERGLRPIGSVEPGERVWAYDFRRGVWELAEVECRHDSKYTGPLVTLDLGVAEITATAYHPFWVISGADLEARPTPRRLEATEDRGLSLPGRWVNSHDLCVGDVVFLRTGEATIRRVSQCHRQTAVCNLTIRGLHTFAVGENQLLVHNTSGTRPYDIALAGGKHAGTLRNYSGRSAGEIEKGMNSLMARSREHAAYAADPARYAPDWATRTPDAQRDLIKYWLGEAVRYAEEADVLRGLLGR